jgi:CubicO group peptidase (beta-lactamase class C family)
MVRAISVACVLVALGIGVISAADPTVPAEGQTALSTFLREAVAKGEVPGVVAMVVGRDRILYHEAFGKQDVAKGVEMRKDSIFRIASMTKPMTSTAVMMLVEEGKIGVDDPVSKYLPRFGLSKVMTTYDDARGTFETRPATRTMTVRHLLTHTSGIGYSWSDPGLAVAQRATKATNDSELPLVSEPGERWNYGASTRVLGDIVQVVTGQRIDTFLQDRLAGPIGMVDTAFDVPIAKHGRVVTVHQRTNGQLVEAPNPASLAVVVRGDGGLYSTANDYAHFLQLILNRGQAGSRRLLKAETVEAMTHNQMGQVRVRLQPTADPPRSRPFPTGAGQDTWGFGFQIAANASSTPHRKPGSLTWAGINNTHFIIDPASGIGAMVLMQVLPFYDEAAMRVLDGFEERLYRHLR